MTIRLGRRSVPMLPGRSAAESISSLPDYGAFPSHGAFCDRGSEDGRHPADSYSNESGGVVSA